MSIVFVVILIDIDSLPIMKAYKILAGISLAVKLGLAVLHCTGDVIS